GLPVRDSLLRGLVESIHSRLGQADTLFRCGNEEFVILMDRADAKSALVSADVICLGLRNYALALPPGDAPNVTIAASIARVPQDGRSLQGVLEIARKRAVSHPLHQHRTSVH